MKKRIVMVLLCAFGAVLSLCAQDGNDKSIGIPDLKIAPSSITISGRNRTVEVYLINPATSSKTYSIGFFNLRMSETGEMTRVDSLLPGDCFADQFLRVTPRRVVLGPKMQQVVRLQFLRPADLADGEYRSNLAVSVIPDTPNETTPPEDGTLNIKLTAIYGVLVPITVRAGTTSATASIADVTLTPGSSPETMTLGFMIERSGNQSVSGKVMVEYLPEGQAKPVVLENGKNYTVFPTIPRRLVRLDIALPEELSGNFHGGSLRLSYLNSNEENGKIGTLLASAEVPVP